MDDDPTPGPASYPRPFDDYADLFRAGTSRADAERHLLIREGFLQALLADPRTKTALQAWEQAIRVELDTLPRKLQTDPDKVGDAMGRALDRHVGPFMQQLGMPVEWQPWVVLDLADAFFLHVGGHTKSVIPRPLTVDRLAPPISVRKTPKPTSGETFAEARQRILAPCIEALVELGEAEVAAAAAPTARGPRTSVDYRKWGRWVYEHRVQQRSRMQIAREEHRERKHSKAFDDCHCRQGTSGILDKAVGLLNVTHFAGAVESLRQQTPGEISGPSTGVKSPVRGS